MAFNGSGVHNRVHDWTQDLANTIPVTASRMDAEHDDISAALSNTICRDGQSTTTARIPFASGASAAAGSTSSVAYSQTNDNDTGIYFPASDQVGIVAGATAVVTVASSGISIAGTLTPSGQLLAAAGTVGAPGISFSSDADCGVYRIGSNNIGLAVNGAKVLDVGTAGVAITGTVGTTGDFAVNASKFTVVASSGNTAVAGTLAVTGNATFNSTLSAADITGSGSISGAAVTGNMVATQSDQETGSATNLIVVPGRQHFHLSAAKSWAKASNAGVAVVAYNVSSISDGGVGIATFNNATSFSSANYGVGGCPVLAGSPRVQTIQSQDANSTEIRNYSTADVIALADPTSINYIAFGDV